MIELASKGNFEVKRSVGIAVSYLNTVVNMAVSLILTSFLLKKLGDTEYGLYQTIASFVNYLVLFEFGIGTVMTRNIAVSRSKNDTDKLHSTFSTMFAITIFFSIMIAAVSIAFYAYIDRIYAKTMTVDQISYAKQLFILLTVYLLAVFYTQCFDGFILGMEQYSFSKMRAIIISLLKLTATLILVCLRQRAVVVVLIDLCLSLMALAFTAGYCMKAFKLRFRLKQFDRAILAASIPLCFALFVQSIINQANSNVDKFVIGVSMSVEDVALYSVTQFFFSFFATIMTIPVSMYLPEMARVMANNPSGEELTQKLIKPGRMEAMIGGVLLGGIFAVGKPFIAMFFGGPKVEAWKYALVVLIPMYVNMTDAVIISVLDVLNKRLARSLALLGTAILNVILTVLLIGKYGILGAVIGTAVSLLLGNILIMSIYYHKKLGVKIPRLFLESYKGILLPCVVAAAIGYAVAIRISPAWLAFLCGGVLYVGIALVWIVCLGLNKDEKSLLRSIWLRIRNRSRI